jgi:hypothetical protein
MCAQDGHQVLDGDLLPPLNIPTSSDSDSAIGGSRLQIALIKYYNFEIFLTRHRIVVGKYYTYFVHTKERLYS